MGEGVDAMRETNGEDEGNTAAATPTKGLPKRLRGLSVAQDDVPASAVAHRSPERIERAREVAIACARLAEDNRGREIVVLDLRKTTPLVDFFVIVTAGSRRQAQAIASEIDAEMKQKGELKLGREGVEEGRWILIDYGDLVIHVFSDDARMYYALEDIWGDAPHVEWQDPNRKAKPGVERLTFVGSGDEEEGDVEIDDDDLEDEDVSSDDA